MTQLVLATTNKNKIAEISVAIKPYNIQVLGLDAFPEIEEIEETGLSFQENALIKARAVAKYTGIASLADDSGLVVDALNGQPGIYSARFGNDWDILDNESRDQRNIRKLLHIMKDVADRQCRYVCSMVTVKPNGEILTVQGEWEGTLLNSPIGNNGFGYDPIFFDPLIGKSAAQLSREEKNLRSHRGKALVNMLKKLSEFLLS